MKKIKDDLGGVMIIVREVESRGVMGSGGILNDVESKRVDKVTTNAVGQNRGVRAREVETQSEAEIGKVLQQLRQGWGAFGIS